MDRIGEPQRSLRGWRVEDGRWKEGLDFVVDGLRLSCEVFGAWPED